MIDVTLTLRNGDARILSLPLRVADILVSPMPYFLSSGTADLRFETPDEALNEMLHDQIVGTLDGGIAQLNLLATLLEEMNKQSLAALREKMPENLFENSVTMNELLGYTFYFAKKDFAEDGTPNTKVAPLADYDAERDLDRLEEKCRCRFRTDLERQRLTGGQLFEAVMAQAKAAGDTERLDAICDYALPEEYEKGKLCSYEYDLLPAVNFGSSEGIYVDVYLKGRFDESGRNSLHIGTIKTLSESKETCKIMGELCGTLLYHENRYVAEILYRFESTESLENMLARPLEMEPMQPVQGFGLTQ